MIKEHKEYFLTILGTIVLAVMSIFLFSFLLSSPGSSYNCNLFDIPCVLERLFGGTKQYDEPPEMMIEEDVDYKAVIKTTEGDFTIDLFEKNAPKSVNNFVFLSKDDYYDGVRFHRVIDDLLIQTGDRNTMDSDPENDGMGDPGYTFDDEIGWNSLNLSRAKRQQLSNLGYSNDKDVKSKHLKMRSVAMANSGPDKNGSQFFIVTADSDDETIKGLEGKHTVFGKVVSGWDVIEKIESAEVDDPNSNSPKPLEDIIILDVIIEEE